MTSQAPPGSNPFRIESGLLIELHRGVVTVHQPASARPHPGQSVTFLHGYAHPIPNTHEPLRLPEWGCATQVRADTQSISVLTDHAGAYPMYEAQAKDGRVVLGTDAWAVARTAGLSDLNISACFDLLAFEMVPGDETLIAGLSEMPPATLITLTWDGDAWQRRGKLMWQLTRHPSGNPIPEAEAHRNLLEVIEPIARQSNDTAGKNVAVNLSGGWDSRAVLAATLNSTELPLLACSYGNPDYPGVKIAQALAQAANVPHKLFPFPDSRFLTDHHSQLCRQMPPVIRFNLADGALAMGSSHFYQDCRAVICGHSGDFFTDLPKASTGLKSRSEMDQWLIQNMRGAFPSEQLRKLLKPTHRNIPEEINRRIALTAEPHFAPGAEGIFRWKFNNRVRRAAAVELRMLQQFVPTIYVPMLDRKFIEFWMAVPDDQLRNQQLYRQMLHTNLFTGPLDAFRQLPRESGTRLRPASPVDILKMAIRNKYFGALRRVSPGRAARLTAADPTALWWATEPGLRQWAWQQIEQSPFIHAHFDLSTLKGLCQNPKPANPAFSRIGVWNLLTVTGVEKHLQSNR